MDANLFYVAHEQEQREAAEWRTARSSASTRPGKGRLFKQSQCVRLLARMIGRSNKRARALEYAAQ
jgi:hypothetical protein